jgi:Putative Ig domain/IPT/TIG domain/FG-GAP repeat
MPTAAGSTAVVSVQDKEPPARGYSQDSRRRWTTGLLVAVSLACLATFAVAVLPALVAQSSHQLPSRHALPTHLTARLPASLAPIASTSIGGYEQSFWPVRHGTSLLTPRGAIHGTFTASGAALRVAQGTLRLSLTGVGRAERLRRVVTVIPTAAASKVLYQHGSISEFYRNGPYGLEQGFALRQRPQVGTGPLVLALHPGGSLTPELAGSQILFRTHTGATALRYGQLRAFDATDRPLPAQIKIRNGTIQLRIDDKNARYPLRVDPFIQQGSKLTGSGESSISEFGFSVALSSDGNTALIGGPIDGLEAGSAWVFVRSETGWEQQGSKLTGSGEIGEGEFGRSVALSSDGNTALVGGRWDNHKVGAAWVFVRSAGVWTQQAKLTGSGESGEGQFGQSVALSSDGNTALIGGWQDNPVGEPTTGIGAAWVFTRSAGAWAQQDGKLTGTGESGSSQLGWSVALSSDGNTALIGGRADNHFVGAAWVFVRSAGVWSQQGSKLTGGGESGEGEFGESVALSSDGNTALVGGPYDLDRATGAAWVFTRSASVWSMQGSKLTGIGESGGLFGWSVALSSDGNAALIGGPTDNIRAGAAWVFVRSGGVWSQQQSKLTGGGESGEGFFGESVALSSDGNTALIGGPFDNGQFGAAWIYGNTGDNSGVPINVLPPEILKTGYGALRVGQAISCSPGTWLGNMPQSYSYTWLREEATNTGVPSPIAVAQGSSSQPTYTVASADESYFLACQVTATNGSGSVSAESAPLGVTGPPISVVARIEPEDGPASGGTEVTVTGSGFAAATAVTFGSSPASSFTVTSDREITAVAPGGTGTVDVTVTGPGGTSVASSTDQFTYFSALQPKNPPWTIHYGKNGDGPVIVNPHIALVLVGSYWCALPGACSSGSGGGTAASTALSYLSTLQSMILNDYGSRSPYATVLSSFGQSTGCWLGFSIGCNNAFVGNISLLPNFTGSPYGAGIIGSNSGSVASSQLDQIAKGFGNPSSDGTLYLLVDAPSGLPCSGPGVNSQIGSYYTATIQLCKATGGNGTTMFDIEGFLASHEMDEAITSPTGQNYGWSVDAPNGSLFQIADPCEGRDAAGNTGDPEAVTGSNPYHWYNLTRDAFGTVLASFVAPTSQVAGQDFTYLGQCTVGQTSFLPIGEALTAVQLPSETRQLLRSAPWATLDAVAGRAAAGSPTQTHRLLRPNAWAPPDAVAGRPYSTSLSVTGGTAPYSWFVAAGELPPGLRLDRSKGTISGTAQRPGAYPVTVQVFDSTVAPSGQRLPHPQQTAGQSLRLIVDAPSGGAPGISGFVRDHALAGSHVLAQAVGSGFSTVVGATSFTFGHAGAATDIHCTTSVTCTMLSPAGPPGSVQVTASVAGRSSSPAHGPRFVFVTPGALSASDLDLPSGVAGRRYRASLAPAVFGGIAPYRFSLAGGHLPSGLSLSSTGTIAGTATSAGEYIARLTVTDASQTRQSTVTTVRLLIAPDGERTSVRGARGGLVFTLSGPATPLAKGGRLVVTLRRAGFSHGYMASAYRYYIARGLARRTQIRAHGQRRTVTVWHPNLFTTRGGVHSLALHGLGPGAKTLTLVIALSRRGMHGQRHPVTLTLRIHFTIA